MSEELRTSPSELDSPPRDERTADRRARPAGSEPALARPGRPAGAPTRPAGPRRARLALKRINPWSVFLFTLTSSMFIGIALIVAVAVLDSVLSSAGVLASVNKFISDLSQDSGGRTDVLTTSRILGFAALLAALYVVLVTALATLGAFLYNLCATFTGGIVVMLQERE